MALCREGGARAQQCILVTCGMWDVGRSWWRRKALPVVRVVVCALTIVCDVSLACPPCPLKQCGAGPSSGRRVLGRAAPESPTSHVTSDCPQPQLSGSAKRVRRAHLPPLGSLSNSTAPLRRTFGRRNGVGSVRVRLGAAAPNCGVECIVSWPRVLLVCFMRLVDVGGYNRRPVCRSRAALQV